MRRLLLALLFPLLLAAQQAAFVHAFQHLPSSVAGTSRTQDERHPPGDSYCQKCFVFAQLGATADLPPVPAVLLDGTFDLIGLAAPVASILPVGTPRNRGPPLPL